MTERQSLVFQLDVLKAEVLSWQKKATTALEGGSKPAATILD